jgi:GNAT superfamily N-acetyltransferase
MADLLVKLYELPASAPLVERLRHEGIEIRRPIAAEKSTVTRWVDQQFSNGWACECEIAFAHRPIGCIVATHRDTLCGFACYGVACPDFLGPIGVAAEWRKQDVGTALLLTGLDGLRSQGYAYAIIGWAGPIGFFQKAVGAIVIENSEPRIYRRRLKKPPK